MEMNTKKLCKAVFMLYKYAIMTKRVHYSTDSNHEHELADSIMDSIIDFADEIAESGFGHYGKPSIGDMSVKIKVDERDSLEDICKDVTDIATQLRDAFEDDNDVSVQSLVSIVDDFLGDIKKDMFLNTLK